MRHASSGPMPVSVSRIKPIGSIQRLKKGAPTVSRSPVTASLSVGNIVAKSTKNAEKSRIQLFARNAASRETNESSSWRARSSGRRWITQPKLKVRMRTMKIVNSIASSRSSPNAWTDWTTPERVMNVPKIVRKNVTMTSVTFHTRSIPRCSWTRMLWRNAVAVNHGRRPAFSTGSHTQ